MGSLIKDVRRGVLQFRWGGTSRLSEQGSGCGAYPNMFIFLRLKGDTLVRRNFSFASVPLWNGLRDICFIYSLRLFASSASLFFLFCALVVSLLFYLASYRSVFARRRISCQLRLPFRPSVDGLRGAGFSLALGHRNSLISLIQNGNGKVNRTS